MKLTMANFATRIRIRLILVLCLGAFCIRYINVLLVLQPDGLDFVHRSRRFQSSNEQVLSQSQRDTAVLGPLIANSVSTTQRARSSKTTIQNGPKGDFFKVPKHAQTKVALKALTKSGARPPSKKGPLPFSTSAVPIEEVNIKIPYPVFVLSLPKSGTTAVHQYFICGQQHAVHWRRYYNDGERTAPCILNRMLQDPPHPSPIVGCGGEDFDIYSDNSWYDGRMCYDPSIWHLEQIYNAYPKATIMLVTRPAQKWRSSARRWFGLLHSMRRCDPLYPDQPHYDHNDTMRLTFDDMIDFYQWHQRHVREFAAAHPSMTFIDLDLESNQTGSILEETVGIPSRCWGHANVGGQASPKWS